MQWFLYEGDWHLCHLRHLCRPCHHDMEGGGRGGGGHRKVCRGTCRDMCKLHLVRTGNLGASGAQNFFEPGKFAKHLIFRPLFTFKMLTMS